MKFLATTSALLLSAAVVLADEPANTSIHRITKGETSEICGYKCQTEKYIVAEKTEALNQITGEIKAIEARVYPEQEKLAAEIKEANEFMTNFVTDIFGDVMKAIEGEEEETKEEETKEEEAKEEINYDEIAKENIESMKQASEAEKKDLEAAKVEVEEYYTTVIEQVSQQNDEDFKDFIEYKNEEKAAAKEIEAFVNDIVEELTGLFALEEPKEEKAEDKVEEKTEEVVVEEEKVDEKNN